MHTVYHRRVHSPTGKPVVLCLRPHRFVLKTELENIELVDISMAEREGFEPPDLLQSTVFKTAAFDHSAISPKDAGNYNGIFTNEKSLFAKNIKKEIN